MWHLPLGRNGTRKPLQRLEFVAVAFRKKIELQKLLDSLHTICPKCGRVIEPRELRRVKFKLRICPGCGERFDAKKPRSD